MEGDYNEDRSEGRGRLVKGWVTEREGGEIRMVRE